MQHQIMCGLIPQAPGVRPPVDPRLRSIVRRRDKKVIPFELSSTDRSEPAIPKGLLVFFSGPTAVGKQTLIKLVREYVVTTFSISYTTRDPRPGETHGKDYFFVSPEVFRTKAENGEFLEWTKAGVNGHFYGTPIMGLNEHFSKGAIIIGDIDVVGVEKLKKNAHKLENCDVVTFFCMPPGVSIEEKIEECRRRGRERMQESDDVIEQRLLRAQYEIEQAGNYDHVILMERDKAKEIVEGQILPIIESYLPSQRGEVFAV